MWTLIVFTFISTGSKDITLVKEEFNIRNKDACIARRNEYERKSAFNVGYCEKQPGDKPVRVK